MRTLNPALQARLDSGAATLCSCWRIERRDGAVLAFTDHDAPVILGDVTCRPNSGFNTGAQEGQTGLAPGTVDIEGVLQDDAITAEAVNRGLFDKSIVERWLVDWQQPTLRHLVFRGTLGDIEWQGAAFRAEVHGIASALNRPLGRVFQPLCDAQLGDSRCGVDLLLPGRWASGRIEVVDGGQTAVSGLDGFAAGWFTDGVIEWTGGSRAGGRDAVFAHIVRDGVHWLATPEPGAQGDSFNVTAGCNRTLDHCAARFGNVLNFRGFPHMPGEDWALAPYPASGIVHDGGRRE